MTDTEWHAAVCNELSDIYRRKNHDYGDSFHKTFEDEGMAMPRIRLTDKLERFKALTRKGTQQVPDESVRDTLLDLANYAIMTVMEMDRSGSVAVEGGNNSMVTTVRPRVGLRALQYTGENDAEIKAFCHLINDAKVRRATIFPGMWIVEIPHMDDEGCEDPVYFAITDDEFNERWTVGS